MARSEGHSILVVDDDRDICQNLSDILTDLGYSVDVAYEGECALALVQKNRYDLALLDFRMPGMDGLTLYRRIKELSAGTVAIIITAFASAATAEEALAAGAWEVLTKPIEFPSLLQTLDQILDQPVVLVVDDDRELCANLWDLLRERSYRVELAHDAQDAARRLRDRDFQIALIDMKLPDASGQSVFELVRQVDPSVRTILITGHRPEMETVIERVLAEGADAVCYKPFDVSNLLQVMERLVR